MKNSTFSKVNNILMAIACVLILAIFTAVIIIGMQAGNVNDILNTNKKFVLDSSWTLSFEDNFDTLDLTKWQTKTPNRAINRAGHYSIDQDTYFVENGYLTIRTMWRNGEYGEGYYTGRLETASKYHNDNAFGQSEEEYNPFAQKFGYYEIRCKVPPAEGIWASFNIIPDGGVAFTDDDVQGTGTDGAEINVFESAYYKRLINNNVVSHGVTVDGYDDRAKIMTSTPMRLEKNIYKQYHTYAVEWTATEYIFYIDGLESYRTMHYNGTSQVNQFIRLAVDVGGDNDGDGNVTGYNSWAGDALNNNYKNKAYDYVVDYVRVYSKK